jgi:hypothetical protein
MGTISSRFISNSQGAFGSSLGFSQCTGTTVILLPVVSHPASPSNTALILISPPVMIGHGGVSMGISISRSIANEQSSLRVTFNPTLGFDCRLDELDAHVCLVRGVLIVVLPTLISGQNGGTSNGGQIGAAQSNIGGGSGGISQSSTKSKSTTGINGTSQFLNSGFMLLRG